MTEPEYGSDEYLLKKWAHLLSHWSQGINTVFMAKLLENQEQHGKTPLLLFTEGTAEESGIEAHE